MTGTKKNPEFPGNPLEQDLKLELHNTLAANTPGAQHILVPNSRHYIQNDAPTSVIQAVKEVLTESVGKEVPEEKTGAVIDTFDCLGPLPALTVFRVPDIQPFPLAGARLVTGECFQF